MRKIFAWIIGKSIRRQLVLGVAMVHLLLMTIFVYDLTQRQKYFLIEKANNETLSQITILVSSSKEYLRTHDLIGLQEVLETFSEDESISYAMIITSDGRVVSHSDKNKIGLYVQDSISLALLQGPQEITKLGSSEEQNEIAAPIFENKTLLGWARIAHDLSGDQIHIEYVSRQGLLYTMAAIIIGTLFAFGLSRIVLRQLNLLLGGAERLGKHQLNESIPIVTDNEVGVVSKAFNIAMEKIDQQKIFLQKAEEKYHALYEQVPVMYFTINFSGTIISANQFGAEELGYTMEELTGSSVHDLFYEEDKLLVVQQIEHCYQNPAKIFHWELRKAQKNGNSMWVHETARVVEEQGTKLLLIACQNITERKQMETAANRQLKFSVVLNEIASVIISTDDRKIILQKTTELLGEALSVDRSLIYDVSFGKRLVTGLCEWLNPLNMDIEPTKAIYPLDVFIGGANEMQRTRQVLTSHKDKVNPHLIEDGSGKILHEQMKIQSLLWFPFSFSADGYYLLVLNTIQSTRDWTNEEIDFLNSVSKQVSLALEKIHLLDERKQAEELLKVSEEKYRFLVENTTDTIALLDLDLNYTFISPSVLRQRGYTVNEAMAQKLKENTTPETLQRAYQLLEEELANEASVTADPNRTRSFELEQYCKDGSTIWVDVTTSFVRDIEGKAIGIFSVSKDITKRKKLEIEKDRNLQIQEALNTILSISVENISLEESLERILKTTFLLPFLNIENKGGIFLADEQQQVLTLTAKHNLGIELQTFCAHVSFGHCLCGKAAATRQIQFADCLDERHENMYNGIQPHGHYNIPILSFGKVLGVIVIYLAEHHIQKKFEQDFLLSVADIISGLIHQKKSEVALRESEGKYRTLIEKMNEGVLFVDNNDIIQFVNERFTTMTGYFREELLGKVAHALLLIEKDHDFLKEKNQLRIQKVSDQYEIRLKRKSGEYIWALISASPILDANGNVIGSIGIHTDITERKHAEKELQENEERYRNIVENLNQAYYEADSRSIFTYCNPALLIVSGYSEQELFAKSVLRLVAEEHRANVAEKYNQWKKEKRTDMSVEFLAQKKNGEKFWAEQTSHYKFDEQGGFIKNTNIVKNIHERKLAVDALRISEERFRNLFENSPIGIYRTTPDGRILANNPALARMLGYSSFEQYASRNLEQEPDAKYSRSAFKERLEREGYITGLESEWYKADRTTISVREHSQVVRDETGKVLYYDGTVEDITERKRAEEAVQEAELKYKALFVNANDSILLMTVDTFIECNPKTEQLFACTREQILNRKPYEFSPLYQPDQRDSKEKALEKINAALSGEPQLFEWVHKKLDGRLFNAEVNLNRIEIGKKELLLAIVRDISERKRAEDALHKSEDRYRQLFENSPIGIYRTTPDGQILAANPALSRMLGYSSFEEYANRNLEQEPDASYSRNVFKERLERDGHIVGLETEWYKSDKTLVSVRENVQAVRDETGNVVYYDGTVEDITDRKHAEHLLITAKEKIEESESKFNAITNQATEGIALADMDGKYIFVNPAFCTMLGYSYEELLAMTVFDVKVKTHPRTDFAESIMKKLGVPIQVKLHRKDGTDFYSEIIGTVVKIKNQDLVLGTVRDITERMQTEEELRKINTAAEQTADSVVISDKDGIIQYVNLAFTKITGYSKEEVLGKNPSILKSGAHSDEFYKILWETIQSGKVFQTTFINKRKDGELIYEFKTITPIKDTLGNITHYVSTAKDISELHHAEVELRKLTQAVLQSPASVVITNLDGTIEFVNPKVITLSGYALEELIGKNSRIFSSNEKTKEEYKELWNTINSGKEWRGEFHNKKKNNELYWVSASIAPIFNEQGKIINFLAIEEDITERKNNEQIIRDVQRRESIGVLAGGIAHDFNNLLNVMMGNISIAQSRLLPDHSAVKNIERALLAMDRAATLTKQLLAYSGKGKFQIHEIDIVALVQDHVSLFEVSLPKNVTLTPFLPAVPIYIKGDPGQFEQVVMNLIINGGDAIGEKQGIVSIKISRVTMLKDQLLEYGILTHTQLKEGEYALFEVSDNGSGMSSETLSKIFDPFFTTKKTGRGLGLSAVIGILRGHECGMTIESVAGEGTTFRVLLPIVQATASQIALVNTGTNLLTSENTKIFIIDDEQFIVDVTNDILELGKYQKLSVTDPLDGIQIYKEQWKTINLVILDYSMPKMNGKDVFIELRKINPNVQVIISSGYSEEEIIDRMGNVKPASFIQKPYTAKVLLAVVGKVLGIQKKNYGIPNN